MEPLKRQATRGFQLGVESLNPSIVMNLTSNQALQAKGKLSLE